LFGQSRLCKQATQPGGAALVLQTGAAGFLQSALPEQRSGVQAFPVEQTSAGGHSASLTQATQEPVLAPAESGRQCGVLGLEAQSMSVPASLFGLHVVALGCTQVCETLQTSPLAQSVLALHATHIPPVEQTGVGLWQSRLELQVALAMQRWFALQIGSADGQSLPRRHCTHVLVFVLQIGSAAFDLQSTSLEQPPVAMQMFPVHADPVPQSRFATQATHAPVSGLQTGVRASVEQSEFVEQVPGSPATQHPEAQCRCVPQAESLEQVGAPTPHEELTQAPLTQVCGDGQSVEVVQFCSEPPLEQEIAKTLKRATA
jgi:hypothetical protein